MPKSERQVNIRLSDNMIKAIDLAIEVGAANNRSDIIRAAIVGKLQSLGIFQKLLEEMTKQSE